MKSPQGVKFRQWATSVLKQYLIKGYVINQQFKLDRYDYQSLSIGKTTKGEPFRATYDNAMEAIDALKEKFGGSRIEKARKHKALLPGFLGVVY